MKLVLILSYCLFQFPAYNQTVQAVVADKITRKPISDVFVFLANSSIGTASGEQGRFEFVLPETKEIVLVFSHINYELLTLDVADADFLRDTFFLQPVEVELSEAVIVEKSKPRLKNRRLRTFTTAFLGEDAKENLVRINNPEVLLFKREKEKLVAEAKEPLVIENKVLGYRVRFYLEAFELYDNNDLLYQGNTFFETIDGTTEMQKIFEKNRQEVYRKSSRRFFSDLVRQQLDSTVYRIGFSSLDQYGDFVNFTPINPSGLLIQSREGEESYYLIFQGFLTVINQDIPVKNDLIMPQNTNLNQITKGYQPQAIQYATSFLRSKTNKIVVNPYGKILNPSDIEEYGYWASLRVSNLLPSDYAPGLE